MSDSKYSVELYTFCYNEERIIPFMIDYWKHLNISHIHVYDNFSTDNSRQILSQYPNWITIHDYDTNNQIDNTERIQIKNNFWKESTADFCIVCDMDEIPWTDNFQELLDYMITEDYDIIQGVGAELMSQNFPEYNKNLLLHQYPKIRFLYSKAFNKSLLFRPNKIADIRYKPGAHSCRPLNKERRRAKILYGYDYPNGIFTLHAKKLSYDYLLEKSRSSEKRLSADNIKRGFSFQYRYPDDKIKRLFDSEYKETYPSLNMLLKNNMPVKTN